MDLILPSGDLTPPTPTPQSAARVPVDPSQTTGFPAAVEFVRQEIGRARGVLGNLCLGGLGTIGTTSSTLQCVVAPGVVQVRLTQLDGSTVGARVERSAPSLLDFSGASGQATAGLLVLQDNGWRSGGTLTRNSNLTTIDIAAGTYLLGGSVISPAGQAAVSLSAAANTGAGQWRTVLVVRGGSTYSLIYGVIGTSPGGAPKPFLPMDTVEVGHLILAPNFTAGTTHIDYRPSYLVTASGTDPLSFGVLPLNGLTVARMASAIPLAVVAPDGGGGLTLLNVRRPRPGHPRIAQGEVAPGVKNGEHVAIPLGGFVLFPGEAVLITATATFGPANINVNEADHPTLPLVTRMHLANMTGLSGALLTGSAGCYVHHWGCGRTLKHGEPNPTVVRGQSWGTSLWTASFRGLVLPSPASTTLAAVYGIDGLTLEMSVHSVGEAARYAMNVFYPTLSAYVLPARVTDTVRTGSDGKRQSPWWSVSAAATGFVSAQLPPGTPDVNT